MPLVFRMVGRAVGKVSGLIQGGRARMMEMSKGSDLMQVRYNEGLTRVGSAIIASISVKGV